MPETLDGRYYRPEPAECRGSYVDESRDPRLSRKRSLSHGELGIKQKSQPVQKRARSRSQLSISETDCPNELFLCNLKLDDSGTLCTRQFTGVRPPSFLRRTLIYS